jgi:hypothetical protein
MGLPEDYFLTPKFDEKSPIDTIRGLNFVSGFTTSDREKNKYIAKIGIEPKYAMMIVSSVKKIYDHLSKKRRFLKLVKVFGTVSEEALKDYFGRPMIKSYGSIARTEDPQRTLARFREDAWPNFISSYDYIGLARLLCRSVSPQEGQNITREIMNNTKEKDVIKIYRLVSRAEEDLVPYLGDCLKNKVKVEIFNANSAMLEETTRNEIRLLSPVSLETSDYLHEQKRLLNEEYMEYSKKCCQAMGRPSDPIYCIRVENDLSLNTDPHYLGNLITRFNNLCGFVKLLEEPRIALEKNELLSIYEYKHDASFRGTVVYDPKQDLPKDGIFVIMLRGGPGRLSALHRVSCKSTGKHVTETIEDFSDEKHRYEKNYEILEVLCETKEKIKEIADCIKGKASNVERERELHSELKTKIIDAKIFKRMKLPQNLVTLRKQFNLLYTRLPKREELLNFYGE